MPHTLHPLKHLKIFAPEVDIFLLFVHYWAPFRLYERF